MAKDFTNEFKIDLQLEGEKSLSGNDLFTLLENIMLSGSISGAAARMGASYRYCWGLIRAAEKTLDLTLVDKQVGGVAGGGTSLTPQGKELLAQYKAFKEEADSQLKRFLARTSKPKTGFASTGFSEKDENKTSVRHLLLASTMEAVETGLMDLLEEAFYHTSGILVRHISIGSGRALELAREGRVVMVLSHAPKMEKAFMEDGWGVEMFPIMANDFAIAGPLSDPAGVGTAPFEGFSAVEAFKKIASSRATFISRGDNSGTHQREEEIWKQAGIVPEGAWYTRSSGTVGNLGVLRLAREKEGYTLVDRATFLISREEKMAIFPPEENVKDPALLLENVFVLTLVNPQRVPGVKFAEAQLFARWLQGKEGRELIYSFGVETFGTPLFTRVS